jgi:hypothetical protein
LSRPKLTPEIAYRLAQKLYIASGELDRRLEVTLARYPFWACMYADYVLHGRFFEGELVIMSSPKYAYDYAREVIKGPWPEAEPVIAQDTEFARRYIRAVLKTTEDHDRFEDVQQWVAQG